jgi:tetratricopeptide (TPR) repeat protein/DNA-binding XRE family transcriptional regulator
MPTFAEQLTQYMKRIGVTDAELARKIGVRRQTIFRWKEGTVGRPRVRADVVKCAECLRLTPEECDQFLLAAGFAPERPIFTAPAVTPPLISTWAESPSATPETQSLTIHTSEVSSSELVTTFAPRVETLSTPLLPARKRRFASPWLLALGLVVILLLFVVGGAWLYRGLQEARRRSVTNALVSSPPVALSTSTATAAPSPAPMLAVAPGGIVVSQFSTVLDYPRYDVAKRIQEAVNAELSHSELTGTTVLIWPQNILTRESADEVLQTTKAALVIWGEYDAGRVVVQFTTSRKSGDQREIAVANPNELNSTINIKVKHEVQLLAFLTLGKVYLNDRLYDKAQIAFEQALALQPEEGDTQATLYFNLGYIAAKLAETQPSLQAYGRAIEHYTRVITMKPDWENGRYNRGTAYIFQSRLFATGSVEITKTLDAALADLSQLISQHPTRDDAYLNRGIAYYERRGPDDMQNALRDFDKVIQLAPSRYEGYYNRALARIRGSGSEGWTTDLTQTLAITPTYAPAFDTFCWGYVLAQDPKRALPFCDKSVALEEQLYDTKAGRVSRGIAYAELGRYGEARNDFTVHRAWLKRLQPATQYERMNGRKVEQWIEAVQQQKNPFDQATLVAIR